MNKISELGTIISGIAASDAIDSAGEIIDIKGIDISSLGSADSILNFEHESKKPSSIVGKITFAKKIFKKEDCDSKDEEKWWESIKKPFVYIKAELFDHPYLGHSEAQHLAALLRYDNRNKGKSARNLVSLSIEGGKLDKEGIKINKSVARDVAATIKHANHTCVCEILDDVNSRRDLYKKEKEIENLKKADEFTQKYNPKLYEAKTSRKKLTPEKSPFTKLNPQSQDLDKKPAFTPYKPKREFLPNKAPKELKPGDRINYQGRPKAKTGYQLYMEAEKASKEGVGKSENNMRNTIIKSCMKKSLTADSGIASPDSLTGGAALAKETIVSSPNQKVKKIVKAIKEEPLMKPYKSDAQRKFFHTEAGKKAVGGEEVVKEWDRASKGLDLPKKAKKIKKSEKLLLNNK